QSGGNTAATLWVGDLANASGGDIPWVNGANTMGSHQLTLTVDPGTTGPTNQLKLENLNKLTGGVVPDSQLFDFSPGPVKPGHAPRRGRAAAQRRPPRATHDPALAASAG